MVLNGKELAEFIKERQARDVRRLKQEFKKNPKLVIIRDNDAPVIDTYVRLKKAYGADIGVEVEDVLTATSELGAAVQKANEDVAVHGVIVQLPLLDKSMTEAVTDGIAANKDVDGLGSGGILDSATAMSINWLLAGYGVDLFGKKIALLGRGKLVGGPLNKMWTNSGFDVTVFSSQDNGRLGMELPKYDVIVAATGVPGLVKSDMVKIGAVVVDAGTASEEGVIKGDVADEVRQRSDVSATPIKGGVGPLTVAALFDNVLRAASSS